MLYAALGAVALVVVTVLVLSRVKKSLTFSRAIMNLALVLSILLFLIYGAAVCAPRVPLKNGSPALLTDLVRRVSDSDFRRANIPGLFVLLVLTTLLWVLATAARGYMAATRAAQEPPEAVQLARAVLCSFRTIQGIKEPGTEKESAEGKVAQVISVKRKRRNWETLISVVHMEVKEDAQENKFYTPSERRYLVKSSRMGSILSVEEQSRK